MPSRIAFAVGLAASLAGGTAMAAEQTAVFAGGCFWSVESHLESIPGVVSAVSGFTGGKTQNPTYPQVIAGDTGHMEAVQVTYDPQQVTYEALLNAFWHSIDPTDPNGQFCDKGSQYRTAVFTSSPAEKAAAEASRDTVRKELGQDVATQILPALPFYAAEDYHQDFAKNNPVRYEAYRVGCGRDRALRAVWGERAFAGLPASH
ncbi:peptide-methionine (S)-S-oxide reductase MsrA [Aureimonas altamirensis]|uniref:peptide-methionine (S)-S-oxide reductase MsrA n=1 Tax=Aureimonas altamirensis TaxID=370622 RepID=UPI00301A6B21